MEHMHHGDNPGWYDLWNPWMMIAVLGAGFVYFYLTGPAGRRFGGYVPVGKGRKVCMAAALLLFWSVEGTPVAFYGHEDLFSAHMLQQSVLYLVLPPLVYLSLPEWLLRPLFAKEWMKRLYPLTHPLISVLGFNLAFSVYHLPIVFDSAYANPILHQTYHSVLMLLAFHMWFPVFCPVKEWNRLSDLQRMAYIFANGVLLTPACALIIFAKTLLYDAYRNAPGFISWLPALDDQQLGGVIMKILQEVVYGTVLAYCFFTWYRKERREEDDHSGSPFPAAKASLDDRSWNRA